MAFPSIKILQERTSFEGGGLSFHFGEIEGLEDWDASSLVQVRIPP